MRQASKKQRATEPSRASLRDIPEIDFSNAVLLGRGPVGLRAAHALFASRRGRPRKGIKPDGSLPRSLRFTDAMWRDLKRCAKQRKVTLHGLLRQVISEWLAKAA
jgi:hypothetical protein